MILLEQHIVLKVYHNNELRKYDVIEMLKDDEGMSFTVYHHGEYLYTLIPKMSEVLTFHLSDADVYSIILFDWDLYLKIEASLYSVFLKEMPS